MKKPSQPSSTWARLSKAYRHRLGKNPEPYTESMDSKKPIVDSPEAENGAAETADPTEPSNATDAASNLEAVAAERDRLLVERADLQDRLLRRQAEFDNFRRR